MFDWWVEQPPFLRTTVALIPVGLGVLAFVVGMWRAGVALTAVGLVLLAFSFPSRSERKGFHDF
jgi:uncharacterized membrane protein YiaA